MTGVSQFESFEELPVGARSLFELAGKNCFFTSVPWFEVFAKRALDDRTRIFCSLSGEQTNGASQAVLAAVQRSEDSGFVIELLILPFSLRSKKDSDPPASWCRSTFVSENWHLDVNGRSFPEYYEGLPSVMKNTISRRRKKLEKSGLANVAIISGGEFLDSAIKAYDQM